VEKIKIKEEVTLDEIMSLPAMSFHDIYGRYWGLSYTTIVVIKEDKKIEILVEPGEYELLYTIHVNGKEIGIFEKYDVEYDPRVEEILGLAKVEIEQVKEMKVIIKIEQGGPQKEDCWEKEEIYIWKKEE